MSLNKINSNQDCTFKVLDKNYLDVNASNNNKRTEIHIFEQMNGDEADKIIRVKNRCFKIRDKEI